MSYCYANLGKAQKKNSLIVGNRRGRNLLLNF